jgi:hypothetical protein
VPKRLPRNMAAGSVCTDAMSQKFLHLGAVIKKAILMNMARMQKVQEKFAQKRARIFVLKRQRFFSFAQETLSVL